MDLPREFSVATGRDEQPHDITIRTATPVKRKFEEARSQNENGVHDDSTPMGGEAEFIRHYFTIPSDEGSESERPLKRQTVSRSQSIQPTTELEDVLVRPKRARLQAHARRLDEAYNDNYRIILNEQIRDAMFKTNHRTLSKVSDFEDSYVGGTLWRAAEKENFFVALARYGRNFSRMAPAIGKTALEVSLYANCLAQGLEKHRKHQFEFDIQDIEGAVDVPVESIEDIETAADGLAWKQFRDDVAREFKRYGDQWLITGNEVDDNGSDNESAPEGQRRSELGAESIWVADHDMLTAEDHELPDPGFAESAMSPPPAVPEDIQALASVRQLVESQTERPIPRPEKPKPPRKTSDLRTLTPAELKEHRRATLRKYRQKHYVPASGVRIQVEDEPGLEPSEGAPQPDGNSAAQTWYEQSLTDQPWRRGPAQPRSRFERASSIAISDMSSVSASTTFSAMADGSAKVSRWWKTKCPPEKRMKLLPVAHLSIDKLKKECAIRGIWVHSAVTSAAAFAEALVDPTWTGTEEFGTAGKNGTSKAKFHSPKAMTEIDFGAGNWVQRGMVLRFIPDGQKYGYYWEDDPIVLVAGYNVPDEEEDRSRALRDTSPELGQWIEFGTEMRSASEPAARQVSLAELLAQRSRHHDSNGHGQQGMTMSEIQSQVGDHDGNDTRTRRSADRSEWRPQSELLDFTFDDLLDFPEPVSEPPHASKASVRKHDSRSEPPQEVTYDPEFSFRLRNSRTPDPSRAVPKWVEDMLEEEGISMPVPQIPSPPPVQDEPEVELPMDHEPVQEMYHEAMQIEDHGPAQLSAREPEQPVNLESTPQTEDGPEPRIKRESPTPNELEATPLNAYETPFDPWQVGDRLSSVSSTEYVPSEPHSEEGRQRQSARLAASATNENGEARAESEAEEDEASSEDEKPDKFTKHIFQSDALIHLSRSFFLNSSEPSFQWSTYVDQYPIPRKIDGESTSITAPLDGPAIFRSAYNTLGAIIRELTRKLVYSSYHRACVRMRSEDDVTQPPAISVLVKESDVHAAIDALHLSRDSQEYWARWATRHECNWEYSFEARSDGSEGLAIPVNKEVAVQCLRLGPEGEEEGEILRLALAGREDSMSNDQGKRIAEQVDGNAVNSDSADDSDVDEEMYDDSGGEDELKDDPEDEHREQEIDEADQKRSTAAMRKFLNLLRGTSEQIIQNNTSLAISLPDDINDQGETRNGATEVHEEIRGTATAASVKPDDTKKGPSDAESLSSSGSDSSTSSENDCSADEDESDSD